MSSGSPSVFKKYYQDEELVYESYSDLIILQSDAILSKKLLSIHLVVTNFVKTSKEVNSQNEILQNLMPYVKELLNSLFEKSLELSFDNQEEMCLRALERIRETLEMVINLFEILNDLITFVASRNLQNKNFPLDICDILYKTFLHCKESNNIYVIYFNSISEILVIFKRAQEVHLKLLKLLEIHLVYNISNQEEIFLLKDVLYNLVNIGILLSGMNVKAMVDNWKGYISLTQKYSDVLTKNMDLNQPLQLLTNEILMNLKGVFEMDMEDINTITYTLKIGNFLVKILSKFCFIFWDAIKAYFEVLWKFLIEIYSFSIPSFKSKDLFCPDQVLSLIKLHLIDALDSLVEKCSFEEEFYLVDEKLQPYLSSYSYVLLTNKIFNNWCNNISKSQIDLNRYKIDLQLNNLIMCLEKHGFLLQTIIYPELIIKISVVIVKLNSTNFSNVEKILCKNIFNKNVIISVFCQELWLEIIKLTSLDYNYEILCVLIDQFTFLLSVKFYITHVHQLSKFLRSLFINLNNDYKLKFTSKFPIDKNLILWKIIGLDLLPKTFSYKKDLENLLQEVTKYVEICLLGNCSLNQFINLINLLNISSTIPFEEIFLNLNKLPSLIIEMWNLEFNEEIIESPFFNLLLEGMFKLTFSLTWKFNRQELIQIFKVLNHLIKSNDTSQIFSIELINKTINSPNNLYKPNDPFFIQIEEIIHTLLTKNVVLKNEAFNIIRRSKNKNDILQSIWKRSGLKTKYSVFFKMNDKPVDIVNVTNSSLITMNNKPHKCIQWDVIPKVKKLKLDENMDLVKVLNRIKEDVDCLKEVSKREPLKTEHIYAINNVIGELNLYLK